MSNPVHLAKFLEGPESWRAWKAEHGNAEIDLSNHLFLYEEMPHKDYSGCDFNNVNFNYSAFFGKTSTPNNPLIFTKCTFIHAHFVECSLVIVDLEGSSFYGASMSGARFANCILTNCNFDTAIAMHAAFNGVDLRKAKFDSTILQDSQFKNANLDGSYFCESSLLYSRYPENRPK